MKDSEVLKWFRKDHESCIQSNQVTEDNVINILKRVLILNEEWLEFLRKSNRFKTSAKIGGFLLGYVAGYSVHKCLFDSIDDLSESDQWDFIGWGVEYYKRSDITHFTFTNTWQWKYEIPILENVILRFVSRVERKGQFPAPSILKFNDMLQTKHIDSDEDMKLFYEKIKDYINLLTMNRIIGIETANRILKPVGFILSNSSELMSKIC